MKQHTNKNLRRALAVLLSVVMALSCFTAAFGVISFAAPSTAAIPVEPSAYLLGKYFSNDWVWYDAATGHNQLAWKVNGYPEYQSATGMTYLNNLYLGINTWNMFSEVSKDTGVTFSYTYTPQIGENHRHILSLGKNEYSGSGSNANDHFYISATKTWMGGEVPFVGFVNGGTQCINARPADGSPAFAVGTTYNVVVTISKENGVKFNINGTDYDAVYYNSDFNGQKANIETLLDALQDYNYNYIGVSRWGDGYFTGSIKDLCIYGKAFTKAELESASVTYSDAFVDEAKNNFDVSVLNKSSIAFSAQPKHVDAPIDEYANYVYASGTSWSGDGLGDTQWQVGRTSFKVAVPGDNVMVYTGSDVIAPVTLESWSNDTSGQSQIIKYVADNSELFDLQQNWQGYSSTWNVWAKNNIATAESFSHLRDTDPESPATQRDSASRFWWNTMKYNKQDGNTLTYFDADYNISYHARTAYRNSASTSHEFREGDVTSKANYYVINYKPVYDILDDAVALYNNQIADQEWKYTEESLNQAMTALYLIQLSNPNNYTYTNAKADVQACASTIKQAVTEYAKINLVKKTGTATFYEEDGTTVVATITADYGDTFTVPAVPTKTPDSQYHYTGAWDPTAAAGSAVMSDDYNKTFTATYTSEAHTGGTATCITQAECSVCHQLYGALLNHSYTAATVKPEAKKSDATCTAPAEYYYSCSVCGAVEANDEHTFTDGDPIAHTYTAATVKADALKKAATCTAPAEYYYSCSVCGAVEANDEHTFTDGDPIAHTYTAATVKEAALKSAATCTSAAVYYYSCSVCGAVESDDEHTFTDGDPIAHTYTAATVKADALKKAATCTAPAEYYYSCSVCGAVEANDEHTFTDGNPIAHTYTAATVKADALKKGATCTAPAEYYYSCSVCGAVEANDEHTFTDGDPIAHTYTAATVKADALKKAATCTAPAEYYYSCSVCGAVENDDEHTFTDGDPIAHTYTAATVKADALKKAATCTAPAEYYYSCSVCGAVEANDEHTFTDGDPIAHTYTAATVKEAALKSAATCTSAAVYYYSCSVCGAVESDDEHTFTDGDPIAHTYTAATVKEAALKSAATCTSAAVYYYSCSVCGAVEANDEHTFTNGDPIAHTYTAATVKADALKKAATCTAPAEYYYSCSVCGAVESNDEHTFTDGDPIAHTYTAATVKEAALKSAATCTSAAVYYYSCSVCGAVESDDEHTFTDGNPIAHTYTAATVKEAALKKGATCTAPAEYYYSCSVCGAVEANDEHTFTDGDPIAHTYTAATVKEAALKSAATCTSAAVYYYSCSVCGAVEANDEHTFTNGDPIAHAYAYSSNNNGTHTVTCANCTLNETENCTFEDATVEGVAGKQCTKCGYFYVPSADLADYTVYDAMFAKLQTVKANPNFNSLSEELINAVNNKVGNPLSRELTADQQGVVDNEVAAIRAILDQILYSDGHGGYTDSIQDSALIHFNVTFNWLSTTLTKTVVKGEGVIAPNVTQMYGVNGHEKHYVFDKWISNSVPANEEAELAAPAVNLNAITEDTVVRGCYRAEDHTGTWTLHPATCEQASQLEITCTTCGVHFTKNGEQGALGHDWDDGRVITEGNCAHPGVMLYTCKRDASHTKNEVIPQTAHVDANRDEICDVCHNPMPGHQHTDWNGDEKCDVCGGKTGVHQHVDDNRDGVCDGCGRNMDGSFRCNLCPFWEQYRGIPVAGWFLTAFHFFYHLICQIVSWR